MEEAIDAAEVNECAVGHEAAHGSVEHVAGLYCAKAAFLLGAELFFEDDAAVDDDIFVGDVELGDAACDFGADHLLELRCIAGAAAAGGHEGAHADVDGEAALDDSGDGADDSGLLRKGFFKCGPVAGLGDLETREVVVALFIAALDPDEELVAGLYTFGVVLESGAREDALRFVADVDEGLFGGEGDDGALDLLNAGAWLVGMALLELGENIGEVFLRLGGWLDWSSARESAGAGGTDCAAGLSVFAASAGALAADGGVCSLVVSEDSGAGWDSEMLSSLMMSSVPLSHAKPGAVAGAPGFAG